MPYKTGDVLHNRYRIVRLLGQGGFGAVYRAWDLTEAHPCALKENLETGQASQDQFEREAKMLSGLSHANLARVTDYFTLPGQGQYLVMEFVEGQNLQDRLSQAGGPLPESQVLPWIEQVLSALAYLHSQPKPIIHRDIKPQNIIISPNGRASLVDFGIAKVYQPGLRTTQGARAVTPGYSPVEQYGRGSTDARSDLYSLGATLYTLLTGKEPAESVLRVTHESLVSPRQHNPNISPETEAILLKAMSIHPADRFQKATDFSSAIRKALGGVPVAALADTLVETPVEQGTPPAVQVAAAAAVIAPALAQPRPEVIPGVQPGAPPLEAAGQTPAIPAPAAWPAEAAGQTPTGAPLTGTVARPWLRRFGWLLLALLLLAGLVALFFFLGGGRSPGEIFSGLVGSGKGVAPTATISAIGVTQTAGKAQVAAVKPTQPPASKSPPTARPSPTAIQSVKAPPTQPPSPTALPTRTRTATPVPPPTPIPFPTSPPIPAQALFTADQPAYCRTGPSQTYKEVYTVDNGQVFPILGRWYDNDWLLIGVDDPARTRTRCCWVWSGAGSWGVDWFSLKAISTLPDRVTCQF